MTKDTRQQYFMENHSKFWPALKRNLLYAPLFTKRHNRELQLSKAISGGTLPGRFHTLLLILYAACNIAYCLVLDWSRSDTASVVAELRGRSGILAALNLIPTVLFALRNNPLIWILGVSYDTFNLLHRWAARIVIFESVVHTLCWLANSIQSGGMHQVNESLTTSTSYRWGMIATVFFVFILCQSLSPVRHAFYETFLTGHRIAVLFAVIGVYVHLEKASLPQKPFLQCVFLLWGGEWLYRIYKLLYYNVSLQACTKVRIEAMQNEACRVTFFTPRAFPSTPGQHAHVYIPSLGWFGSHPFSVAWTASPTPASQDFSLTTPPNLDRVKKHDSYISEMDLEKAIAAQQFSSPSSTNPPNYDFSSSSSGNAIATSVTSTTTAVSFVMRARTGFTRQLYDRAAASPSRTLDNLCGAIEGPYGGHEPLSSYGTVVLFAAGVGITHQMPYLRQLLRGYAEGTVSTRKIVLVWTVPDTASFEWVRPWMEEILPMPGRREALKLLMFVTRPRNMRDVVSASGFVQMHGGRCNVQEVLDKEIWERVGAMCVTVCGPGAFADGVRHAVRERIHVGNLDFIEEAFTY
ncbi:hypothetical protein EV356DRAFT_520207 [Viridothelium virens]|uniref:FAD-binding FR-type domain-containing protein n=1 Tax=Viridothelium virens TaxID=1048519 RepID=A0A6A6GWV5_VIRVR|nr:hypothetical protein EV356DRAFT_520207 [Viridothelium virens]